MSLTFSISKFGTGSSQDQEKDPSFDLIAVGELLIDLISEESMASIGDARLFKRHVGGEAANVAHNVARLGGRSALVARLGDDGFATRCRRAMAEAGVDTRYLITDPTAPTTLSVIARNTGTPDFAVYRGADRNLRVVDLPLEAIMSARAVHASSFVLSHEPGRSAVLEALRLAKGAGALVSLDPTYHPKVWGPDQNPLPVLEEAYALVDVTKPSLDDCHRLFGPGEAPEQYARRFLTMGPRLVALTMGAQGVLMATAAGQVAWFPSRKVPVADVTGAGDAFWSGLLVGLLDGQSDADAIRLGLEVAAAKVQMVGPLPAALDRQALYRQAGLTGPAGATH